MRQDKEKALILRREGKSYREIHTALHVPLSTLSKWFSGYEWSSGLRHTLVREGGKERQSRMRELNEVRGKRLAKSYEQAEKEAVQELAWLKHDPLFVAGVMLYYADGDKGSRGQVRFSTGDLEQAKFYLHFLTKSCGVPVTKVRASLANYVGQDDQSNRRFWGFALGGGVKFTKSSMVPGRFDARKLQYGICTLTVSSVYLKIKMLAWVKLLPKQLIAGR